MCVWQQARNCCSCYKAAKKQKQQQNAFFFFFTRTRGLLVCLETIAKTLFPHRPSLLISPVILANATVAASALHRSSRFNFHCYTQRKPTPTQKSAREVAAATFRDFSHKRLQRGIHSCKPVSLALLISPSFPPPPGLSVPASTSPETTRR